MKQGASLIGHLIGHSVHGRRRLRHRLVKRGCSTSSSAACNRTRGRRVRSSIETGCGRWRRLEDRGGCSCRGASCSAA